MLKHPDLEKERSERKLTAEEFLDLYNENLPERFPNATVELMSEFRDSHKNLFKHKNFWSLGEHRKKLMDWLSQNVKPEEN